MTTKAWAYISRFKQELEKKLNSHFVSKELRINEYSGSESFEVMNYDSKFIVNFSLNFNCLNERKKHYDIVFETGKLDCSFGSFITEAIKLATDYNRKNNPEI